MRNWLQWGRSKNDDELKDVEVLLQAALQPVPPRPEYVKNLHWRLTSQPQPVLLPVELRGLQNFWMILAGVLSGFVLLALGIRILAILTTDRSQSGMQRPLAS